MCGRLRLRQREQVIENAYAQKLMAKIKHSSIMATLRACRDFASMAASHNEVIIGNGIPEARVVRRKVDERMMALIKAVPWSFPTETSMLGLEARTKAMQQKQEE